YGWVREAFGEQRGFLAICCDRSENLTWFPTVLAFIAGSLAYAIEPSLASNNVFLVVVMLTVFWAATLLNFLRIEQSTLFVSAGTSLRAILPILLLGGLALAWFAKGESSQIPFSGDALLPDLSGQQRLFLGGVLLGFASMEMAGFHAMETRDPQRPSAGDHPLGRGYLPRRRRQLPRPRARRAAA